MIRDPFMTQNHVIVQDRNVLMKWYNQKNFLKKFPALEDDKLATIRSWYHRAQDYAMTNGMFIQAYELLTEDAETAGFAFGKDIPAEYQSTFKAWEHDLNTVLRESKIMPTQQLRDEVRTTTNGYHSLHAVIRRTHPHH